jgi:hypothetical protein
VPGLIEFASIGVHGSAWCHRQAAVRVVCMDQMSMNCRKLPAVPCLIEFTSVGVHGSAWRHRQAAVRVVCMDQMSMNCRKLPAVPGPIKLSVVNRIYQYVSQLTSSL